MVATIDNGYSYLLFQIIHKENINTSCQQSQPLTTSINIYYFKSFIKKYIILVVNGCDC